MNNSVLLGVWRIMLCVPPALWQSQLEKETRGQADLAFMIRERHLVRDIVVREMPRFNRTGVPSGPARIASSRACSPAWVAAAMGVCWYLRTE